MQDIVSSFKKGYDRGDAFLAVSMSSRRTKSLGNQAFEKTKTVT